jgi:predicted nuclease of predicted toxin-antitoxin system
VLERAAAEDRILITTDTDFPTLLALSGEPIPSVLLLRGIGDSIQGRLAAILNALPSIQEELEAGAGAVAVVERDRVRLRSLPIEPT